MGKKLDKDKIDLIAHYLVQNNVSFTYAVGVIAIIECSNSDILRNLVVNYNFILEDQNFMCDDLYK